ncbi:MAG: hypothetical protein V4649_13285 [Bacteroidota bacterium]
MNTAKFLIFGALTVGVVMLLTSDKARGKRKEVEDSITLWSKHLKKLSNTTIQTVGDLKLLLGAEIKGLSSDTRSRLLKILSGVADTGSKLGNNVNKQFS